MSLFARLAARLDSLACGLCGADGPHAHFDVSFGGASAVCVRCREASQHASQDVVQPFDRHSPSTVVSA